MSTAIGSLIDGIFGLIGSGLNMYQTDKTNRENRDYATQMTNAQWERDDSSLQRQVLDAQKAGLSPLAVTGSMNSSSPLNYVAQAPQMDLSSLIGLASRAQEQYNQIEHEESESQKEREFIGSENAKKLQQELKIWNEELENRQDTASIDIKKFNSNLQYQLKILSQNERQFKSGEDLERLSNLAQQSLTMYQNVCASIGVTPKVKYVSDVNQYYEDLGTFFTQYGKMALKRGHSEVSDKTSQSTGSSANVNAGAGKYGSANIGSSEQESATIDMTKTNSYYDLSDLGSVSFPIFTYSVDSDYDDSPYKFDEWHYDFNEHSFNY